MDYYKLSNYCLIALPIFTQTNPTKNDFKN